MDRARASRPLLPTGEAAAHRADEAALGETAACEAAATRGPPRPTTSFKAVLRCARALRRSGAF